MPLPASGSISLTQVQTEFGGANPIGINEYYKGGAYVSASDNAPNVPASGTIDMNDFWGASKAVPPPSVEIHVLSGGGSGGPSRGGGGGSGGYFVSNAMNVISGTYTVTVGGAGAFSDIVGPLGGGVAVTVYGGGAGGASSPAGSNQGANGGSGGGSAGSPTNPLVGGGTYNTGVPSGIPTTYDSASDGGAGRNTAPTRGSGGGGGTAGLTYNGAVGQAGTSSAGGNGGNGYTWPYDGVTRGAGGGGAPNGTGGAGGGGNGVPTGAGGSAPANSGSGGGGGSTFGTGGSGLVLIRYSSTYSDAISTTGSPTYTNSGGFKNYLFTGSGSIQWK